MGVDGCDHMPHGICSVQEIQPKSQANNQPSPDAVMCTPGELPATFAASKAKAEMNK